MSDRTDSLAYQVQAFYRGKLVALIEGEGSIDRDETNHRITRDVEWMRHAVAIRDHDDIRVATGPAMFTRAEPYEDCGIHTDAHLHICGKLCPACKSCAERTRMKIDERGDFVEVRK